MENGNSMERKLMEPLIKSYIKLAINNMDPKDISNLREKFGSPLEETLVPVFPEEEYVDKTSVEMFLRDLIKNCKQEEKTSPIETSVKSKDGVYDFDPEKIWKSIPEKELNMAIRFTDKKVLDYLREKYGQNLEGIIGKYPADRNFSIEKIVNFLKDVYERDKKQDKPKQTVSQSKKSEIITEKQPKSKPTTKTKLQIATSKANEYLRKINYGRFTLPIINEVLFDNDLFSYRIIIIMFLEEILANYSPTDPVMGTSLKISIKLKLAALKKAEVCNIDEIINRLSTESFEEVQADIKKAFYGETKVEPPRTIVSSQEEHNQVIPSIQGKDSISEKRNDGTTRKETAREKKPNSELARQEIISASNPPEETNPIVPEPESLPMPDFSVNYTKEQIDNAIKKLRKDPFAINLAYTMGIDNPIENCRKSVIVILYFGLDGRRDPKSVKEIARIFKGEKGDLSSIIEEIELTILEFLELYGKSKEIEEIFKLILFNKR